MLLRQSCLLVVSCDTAVTFSPILGLTFLLLFLSKLVLKKKKNAYRCTWYMPSTNTKSTRSRVSTKLVELTADSGRLCNTEPLVL